MEILKKNAVLLYFLTYVVMYVLLFMENIENGRIDDYFYEKFNSLFHFNPDFDYFGLYALYTFWNPAFVGLFANLYNKYLRRIGICMIILINLFMIAFQLHYYLSAK